MRPVLVGAQYLRAAAALGVVADHSCANAAFPKYLGVSTFGGAPLGGAAGVDLFFVLSGFIMAYVNLDERLAPRRAASTFFKERFARVAPLLWLVCLVYLALATAGFGGAAPLDCVRAALLSPVGKMAPNVVWTLRQELLFYTLFGLTYMWRAPRWLLWVWFAAPLAVWLAQAHPRGLAAGIAKVFAGPDHLEFGAGFALGVAWLKGAVPPLRRGSLAALCLALVAVFAGADLTHYARSTLQALPMAATCGIAVWAAASVSHTRGFLARGVRRLGDASYSIYLAHSLAISLALRLIVRDSTTAAEPAVMLVFVVATAFGLLVYELAERRLVGWTRRSLRIGDRAAAVSLRTA